MNPCLIREVSWEESCSRCNRSAKMPASGVNHSSRRWKDSTNWAIIRQAGGAWNQVRSAMLSKPGMRWPMPTVIQRVILFRAVKRIDFEVSLLGWDGTPYREFRLAFPVRAEQGRVAYEVPFGVLEVGEGEMKGAAGERYTQEVSRVRPRAIQNWIGLYGTRSGVTLSSSVAVWDYLNPTDPAPDRFLLQPVLLASRRSCHGEGPWYLQKGDHHYRFSLTSHGPARQSGQRQGVEANTPLIAVVDPPRHPQAQLAESGSFVSLDADNLVLSTMKKCEDDESVIVRLFDDAGKRHK